ncbi:MAG: glycosyl transferase family 1, partial [Crocinitomicaceae bacterium]|nr:glycosyl transferase family 1 [Crocinitomicaceae bacterium]
MEKERSALLITYYWPPAGGAGVHRWLRMSRYFKENKVNLHVYCPQDAAWPIIDLALNEEVSPDLTIVRRKIFEPHRYLGSKNNPNKGAGITQNKKAGIVQRFIIWVRGNLFIPDARVCWIRPSARFLKNYLKEHPEIDTIISTGPPHSMHLIARRLKHKFPTLNWVADFRDPWTEIDFYQELLPGKWADFRHKRLEKSVLSEANTIVTVSAACAEGLSSIVGRKVEVVTNGFIFPDFDEKQVELDKKFTIAHFGSMPYSRNPDALWIALENLLFRLPALREHLEIKLVGSVDFKIHEILEEKGLATYVNSISSVSHAESLQLQRQTQLLLLIANNSGNTKGILTGKFFEYLGAKRPILAIGEKESDLEQAMQNTQAGLFADFWEAEEIGAYLEACYTKFLQGENYHKAINLEPVSYTHLACLLYTSR